MLMVKGELPRLFAYNTGRVRKGGRRCMDGASWRQRSWMMKPVSMADKFSNFFIF